jgi:hypothetical protein
MFNKVFLVLFLAIGIASADIDVENNYSEGFKISGYFDGGFSEWGSYNAVPSRGFTVRRSGFEVSARVVETLKADIKIETRPDELFLKNATIRWSPLNWAEVQAGQFKSATLLAGELSYWNLNMFDRPLVYNLREDLTFSGRDIGFDMHIELPEIHGVELTGAAGVFNGDQRGAERTDDELLYTVRGEMGIPSIDLTLGASATSHRQGISNPEDPSGYSVSSRQNAISADFSMNCKISNWYSFSASGEVSVGDNWRMVEVVAGDDAPAFAGYWGNFTAFCHPWRVGSIKTISISLGYDYLNPDTDNDYDHRRISMIGAVYPSDSIRFRFGRIVNRLEGFISTDNYTDYIAEVGIRF